MAITLGTPTSGTAGGSNTLTIASLTVAAGESLVVAYCGVSQTETISTCVFDSGAQSLTLVHFRAPGTAGTASRTEVWEIAAPSAGTGTVTITTTGTPQNKCALAFTIAGAAAGAGYRDAVVRAGGLDTTPVNTIPSAVNDLAITALGWRDSGITFTADASPVAEFGAVNSGAASSSHCSLRMLSETGAASTSPSGTLSSSQSWGVVGFNINIAGGASTAVPVFMNQYRQRWG